MRRWELWTAASAFLFHSLCGVEMAPWYGPDKLLEITPWATYEWFPQVDTAQGKLKRHGDNQFYGVNLSIATNNDYAVELETITAKTNQHSFAFENLRFTFRKQWFNDIVGDPFSLVTGATISTPSAKALRDFSTIYHGRVEFEGHAAVGRECSKGAYWQSRWWGALALGKADQGCPWVRARGTWERNYCDQHQWRIFAEGSGGSGHKRLSLLRARFPGYGKIKYRTVDVGGGYSYLVDDIGRSLTAEYSARVWGSNAPIRVQAVTLSLLLPFNL